MITKRKESSTLSLQNIDVMSQICSEALTEAEANKEDILRIRLSLEEILEEWFGFLGEVPIVCNSGQRFGKQYIEFRVSGSEVPYEADEASGALRSSLLAAAGLSLIYNYKHGANCLAVYPPKKARMGQLTQLVIAVVMAAVLGMICQNLSSGVREGIYGVTDPLFYMMLSMLRTIASPMIFLTICCGIINIGDLSVLGRMGKKLISRMCSSVFIVGGISALCLCAFFPLSLESSTGIRGSFSDIYQMLIDIVPGDIISPFQNGNTLQIIFMGACVGAVLLVLGDRGIAVRNVIEQMNEVVLILMSTLGRLVPAFVFLSIFSLMQSDFGSELPGLVKAIGLSMGGCLLLMFAYILILSIRLHVSANMLIRKLLPTYLIGLSTGSSVAAFATNLDTCENKLGISQAMTHFAVPLGQVIFMPGAMIGFLIVCLSMAESYDVAVTPVWMVTAVIIIGLLSIAAPPVPGGALTCYSVMFSQLGIPAEALALAMALNALLDFIMTSTNLTCLQTELVLSAHKLKKLDESILRDKQNIHG